MSVSQNGLVAMTDKSNSILIWRQRDEQIPPSGENGSIISIIFNTYHELKSIKWIFSSDYLAIHDGDQLIILNVYENREILKINYTEEMFFSIQRGDIFVAFSTSNRIKYFNIEINWDLQPMKGMIWLENEYIVNRTVRYDVSDKGIVKEDRAEVNYDRRIKRKFKHDIGFEPNELFAFSQTDYIPESLIIPDSHSHHLRDKEIIAIQFFDDCIIYQTDLGLLITVEDENIKPVFLPEAQTVVIPYTLHKNVYAILTPKLEYQLEISADIIKVQKLKSIIANNDLNLNNTIISFLIDTELDIAYSKINTDYGYLWLDDLSEYHLFLDLLTNQIYFIQNSIHRQNVEVFVNENGTFILEWERGMGYPEGYLLYREITNINEPTVLYNVNYKEMEEDIESNDETEEEIEEFGPLIIPAWHQLNMKVIYQKQSFEFSWSKSCIYALMAYWSKQDDLESVQIENTYPLDVPFLKFCNLSVTWKEKKVPFEAISPYYVLNKELGRIITYSIDEYLYIWDLDSMIPSHRIKSNLPVRILEGSNGKFLALISFEISNLEIITQSEEESAIPTKYPHIILQVINLEKSKSYFRKYPFPTHLVNHHIDLKFDKDIFRFEFPSYIDKTDTITVMFDLHQTKFLLENRSEITQFWKSHTQGLETSQVKKGNEFPVNPHPELDRDIVKRNFIIVDEGIYRKSDGECYMSIYTHGIKIEQKSNDFVHSHQGKFAYDMPFSSNRYRPIYLEADKFELVKGNNLVNLESLTELPKILEASTVVTNKSEVYLARLKTFVENLFASNVVHNDNSILFYSNSFKRFQKHITPLLNRVLKRTKKPKRKKSRKKSTKKTTKKAETEESTS